MQAFNNTTLLFTMILQRK